MLKDDSEPEFCEACAQAKPHRQPFPDHAQNRAENFGDRIHADMAFLHCKNQTFQAYLNFEKQLEMQNGAKIKILRSDHGREFRP
jgi:hypothetical protein